MAAPFCTSCGATVAEGTRFCVKCGQPVGQAAPAPVAPIAGEATVITPIPPPPPVVQQPVREGTGAGIWIGLFGVLLLLGGAGLWLYSTHRKVATPVQVADSQPTVPQPTVPQQTVPQPTPSPTPVSTFVPAPTPVATTEVIPPNPDQQQPPPVPAVKPRPVAQPDAHPPSPPPPAPPPPVPPRKAVAPTTGVLHASVEVAQNGEVVFENLPSGRLHFIFDHALWQPTISRQANGTQTLVMRSLKPGIQTTCDVKWEIVQ